MWLRTHSPGRPASWEVHSPQPPWLSLPSLLGTSPSLKLLPRCGSQREPSGRCGSQREATGRGGWGLRQPSTPRSPGPGAQRCHRQPGPASQGTQEPKGEGPSVSVWPVRVLAWPLVEITAPRTQGAEATHAGQARRAGPPVPPEAAPNALKRRHRPGGRRCSEVRPAPWFHRAAARWVSQPWLSSGWKRGPEQQLPVATPTFSFTSPILGEKGGPTLPVAQPGEAGCGGGR